MQKWRAEWTRFAWLPALLVLLAYLFADAAARRQDSDRVTRARANETVVPAFDPASPTGYAFGQHRLLLLPYSVDGYHWILQTEEVLRGAQSRVRFITYDNAPTGREAHWSSGLVWWLAGLAWIDHALTGRPLPLALEHIAPLALPILFALGLIVLTPLLARRFGSLVAIVVAAGLVFCQPFAAMLTVGYIDHHAIVGGCALLSVLLLAAGGGGWIRNPTFSAAGLTESEKPLALWLPDRAGARRWFVAAAIAGAAGLWVSAATQVPVLVGIGLGIAANAVWLTFRREPNGPWRMDPTLWRTWGIAGAIASLGFYLLEYFPNHWALRLEVNHPLYALAWLGAGDLLCRWTFLLQGDLRTSLRRTAAASLPGFLAVLTLPLLILLARDRVFVVADPFLWALHADYIQEFQPFLANLGRHSWQVLLVTACHPLLGLLVPCLLLARRGIERPWKSLLMLTAAPVAIGIGLALKQERWLILACALSIAALAISVLVVLRSPSCRRTRFHSFAAAAVLGLTVAIHPLWWGFYFTKSHPGVTLESSTYLTVRSLAHTLRQRLGAERGVIVGGFSATTEMIYFGGFRGLGTGYWENRDGLRSAVELLGADSDEAALALIRKHGITHIVDASWDFYSTPAVRLIHGLPKSETPARTGFLNRLEEGKFPSWVRPVIAVSERQNAMVYEIDFQQTPEEALVHNARFFAEVGDTGRADAFLEQALAADPGNAAALAVRARRQALRGDRAGLDATLRHLDDVLRRPATLEAADRIDLADAWLAAGNEARARAEISAALASTNERELRRLSAPQLRRLLELSRRWNSPFPDGLTPAFAESLLPKLMRPAPADASPPAR